MNWLDLILSIFRKPLLEPVQRDIPKPPQLPVIIPQPVLAPEISEPVIQESDMQSFYTTELVLKRGLFGNSSGQIGELFDERGKFLCHILEDPTIDGQKVWGETAIPAGTYELEANTWHGRAAKHGKRWAWHRKEVWHLLDVRGFEYIQMHTGNTPADTLGCPLFGVWDKRRVFVGQSVTTYRKIYERYADRVRAGVVSIRIEDA